MKAITALLTFSVLAIAFLVISCDNTLDIIEPSGDIPIVYGFLSPNDSIQLIRLERAFVDANTSALELAKDPAQLFYDENTTVILRSEGTGIEYSLDRVDGTTIGYVRDSGIFPETPNILYTILTDDIDLTGEDETFTLEIQRPGDVDLVTAQTKIVGESRIIRPIETNPVLDFSEVSPTAFKWRTGENAKVYDLYLRANYQERIAGEDWVNKSVLWVMATDIIDNVNQSVQEYLQDAPAFYSFISREIETDPTKIRRFVNLDLVVNGGTAELLEYQRVANANLGITSTQDVPTFSNISAGRGIFASTYTTVMEGIRLANPSKDSIISGRFTKDLNFE